MIKTYRDLFVWQKSMSLVTAIYKATQAFPFTEQYGLTLQLRKCAVSIPSNIAEGYGRRSTADYRRFLLIALGSLYELQTQLQIGFNLEFIGEALFTHLFDSSKEVERMLSALVAKI